MSPIETRSFTLYPELLAWPSYRLSTARMMWVYLTAAVLICLLLIYGMQWSPSVSVIVGICSVAIVYGVGYLRYAAIMRRPQNRAALSGSTVRIDDEEIRQDFSDGSHLAFKWFAVTGLQETGDFFWVFAPKRHVIIVPKAAFSSLGEAQTFWSAVRGAAKT